MAEHLEKQVLWWGQLHAGANISFALLSFSFPFFDLFLISFQLVSYPLEIWQVLVLRPVLSRGAAHQVEDLVDLLHLAFA